MHAHTRLHQISTVSLESEFHSHFELIFPHFISFLFSLRLHVYAWPNSSYWLFSSKGLLQVKLLTCIFYTFHLNILVAVLTKTVHSNYKLSYPCSSEVKYIFIYIAQYHKSQFNRRLYNLYSIQDPLSFDLWFGQGKNSPLKKKPLTGQKLEETSMRATGERSLFQQPWKREKQKIWKHICLDYTSVSEEQYQAMLLICQLRESQDYMASLVPCHCCDWPFFQNWMPIY